MIPQYRSDLRRKVFTNQVSYRPIADAMFRGQPVQLRAEEPSQRRRMEVAGYSEEIADREVMLVLDEHADEPQAQKEYLHFEDREWRIVEARRDAAAGCWMLIVTKAKR
jgi:hypothetical protein